MYVYTIVITFQTMPFMTSPLPFALFRSSLLSNTNRPIIQSQTVSSQAVVGLKLWLPGSDSRLSPNLPEIAMKLPKVGLWKEISTGGMPKQQKMIPWFKVTPLIETPNSWYTHFHVIDTSSNTLQAFPEIIHLNRKPLESIRTHIDDLSSFFRLQLTLPGKKR